jgi:hypothetical protein
MLAVTVFSFVPTVSVDLVLADWCTTDLADQIAMSWYSDRGDHLVSPSLCNRKFARINESQPG